MTEDEEANLRAESSSARYSISTLGHNDTQEPPLCPGNHLRLTWWDIRYCPPKGMPPFWKRIFHPKEYKKAREPNLEKEILHGVLGEVLPGEMVALMGGSGSGKTTLLNLLAGRTVGGFPSGTVQVNGRLRDPKTWRYLASYVEQQDILDGELTVQEIIQFACRIKLPSLQYSNAQKDRKAQKLIEALGLVHVANTRIGTESKRGISGGELKRVSIAIELAAERRMIFLDEPTTGLDAATSLYLIKTLAKFAVTYQLSIIMSIHQPRDAILKYFSKVMLLSQGRMVFFGNLEEILEHFKSLRYECPLDSNPADFSTS